jgi:hypothetical protein
MTEAMQWLPSRGDLRESVAIDRHEAVDETQGFEQMQLLNLIGAQATV